MKLINNWQKMWKSLAVILPTVAVFAIALIGAAKGYIDGSIAEIVRAALASDSVGMAIVVLVLGFIGRIIKQPNLKE